MERVAPQGWTTKPSPTLRNTLFTIPPRRLSDFPRSRLLVLINDLPKISSIILLSRLLNNWRGHGVGWPALDPPSPTADLLGRSMDSRTRLISVYVHKLHVKTWAGLHRSFPPVYGQSTVANRRPQSFGHSRISARLHCDHTSPPDQ